MNIHISGNLSKPTVIFLAGWPDTCDVFRDNVMATLAADHRIVGITIPGFEDEHPFMQDLREREQAVQLARQEELRRRGANTPWWSVFSPFHLLRHPSAVSAASSTTGYATGGLSRAPLQTFGLPDRSDCLQPFTTPTCGHSFEDLVTLLEIAVDTAMETCNYCPAAMPPTSNDSAAETDAPQESTAGVAAHQLPPTYTQPVLIAHDWGCVLAYELLLARPGLFSRIVAMDVGASVFEHNAAHVERMCALVSGDGRRTAPTPANPAVASTRDAAQRVATGLSVDAVGGYAHPPGPSTTSPLRRRTSGTPPLEDSLSSPVTVAHGVAAARRFGAPASPSFPLPLRGVASSPITKRSLASQYAIRTRKSPAPPRRGEFRRALFFFSYQLFLIICGFLVPRRLSRWLLNIFVKLGHRQPYSYDPQMVATPTMELINHTLNVQFFTRHPYALENRGAMQVAMLLQCNEKARRPASPTAASEPAAATAESGFNRAKPPPQQPARGWKIMLIPYVERPCSAPPLAPQATTPRAGSESISARHPCASTCPLGASAGEGGHPAASGGLKHTSTRTGRARQQDDLREGSSVAASVSSHSSYASTPDVAADALNGRGGVSGSMGERRSTAEYGHVVYSSYAKGASIIVDEWDSMLSGTVDVDSAARLPMGGSGELDPYTAMKDVAPPPWAGADPLALTGAQCFLDPSRSGSNGGDDYFLMSADGTIMNGCRGGAGDGGSFAGRAAAPGAPSGQMQVVKRRIFYQAVVFPPLLNDAGSVTGAAASSTFRNDTDDGSASGNGSYGTGTTVLSRLRRKSRAAPLRPAVRVRASPRQSWIYLRFWLSVLLMAVVSGVSRLLGQSATTSSAMSDGPAPAAGRTSSNVMTTSMTTIYRRLPAPPSLAADVSTLPGNGDVVLQPRHYSPLLTIRYFVPLSIPILYMYGGGKEYMFHADHWCTYIRQHRRRHDGISDVVEVQGGGHWFFAEKKYQKKVADRIAEFIAATPSFTDEL